jgi:hypothetical protein
MFDCGKFHLTAWRDGAFVLPPLLSRGLALAPWDILLIERSSEHSLFLRIFREVIAFHQGIIDPESRWLGFLLNFRGIPTVIDGKGRLVIPPEALEVHEGETLTLKVFQDRSLHCMFLSRLRLKEPPRNPRWEPLSLQVSLN